MQDEDMIENLIRQAGKRQTPDSEVAREVEIATRAAWKSTVSSNRRAQRRKAFGLIGMVATVIVVVGVGFLDLFNQQPVSPIAAFAHTGGTIKINGKLVSDDLATTSQINSEDEVTTENDSYLSIKLSNGITLILGENTRMRVTSLKEVSLLAGKLYFDSPDSQLPLTVHTPQGDIVDVGTQYEALATDNGLRISMRDGAVKLSVDGVLHSAAVSDGAGDVLLVQPNNTVSRSTLATTDKYWQWVLIASEDILLEGKTVYDVLDQAARLTGRKVFYKNSKAKLLAQQTRLSGGVLDPEYIESSLSLLLNTTTLTANLQTDSIEVDSAISIQ